jgi:uncharacterized protein YgbK (DUF1537 family)
MSERRSYSETLSRYAAHSAESLRTGLANGWTENNLRMVVLDDDPTGIQTVHGCLLLTNWKTENLEKAFQDESPLFYLLTNTRSMTAEAAAQVTRAAVRAVVEVNRNYGFRLIFVSRSDSTLRGHFPLEPDCIRRALTQAGLSVLPTTYFIPAFIEAGRFTVEGSQYLRDGDKLIPVSETEFARDNAFGYQHSMLSDYIVEKTGGSIGPEQIGNLRLEDLRQKTVPEIAEQLRYLQNKAWTVVDALRYDDLWKFSAAFRSILPENYSYTVIRSSSSLPKALCGMPDKALLSGSELVDKKGVGLIVVGSHVRKSSLQLEALLRSDRTKGIELDVRRMLDEPESLLSDVWAELERARSVQKTPVMYTSREELRFTDVAERLRTGSILSDLLVRIVQELPYSPSFLVAKGGITSHDLLTKGLGIEQIRVAGQVLPGVPVVRTSNEHRFPDIPYVVFPGNVGETDALLKVHELLTRPTIG